MSKNIDDNNSNDISPLWIEGELDEQRGALIRLQAVYAGMKNKETTYAKGIERMIRLRMALIDVCNKFYKEAAHNG